MTTTPLQFDDELSAFDYVLLRGERNPKTRSSIMALIMLDKAPATADISDTFERASRSFVRLRQRVVVPTYPVTQPLWVVDPDFDLKFHLRRVNIAAPGKQQEILEFCNQFLCDPIDLQRPLWEAILLEGLKVPGCKAALVVKMHHALTDGMGGMKLFQEIFDRHADAPRRPMPPLPIPEELSGNDVVRKGLLRALGNALPTARKNFNAGIKASNTWFNNPRQMLETLRQHADSARRMIGPLPVPASPLLRQRSIKRALGTMEFPLADLRKPAKAAGATVNDAYLAAVAGGLRRYHEKMGVQLQELTISMPVNQRKSGDTDGGNRFSGARIVLPIAEKDPATRLALIHKSVKESISEPAMHLTHYLLPLMVKLPDTALAKVTADVLAPEIQASNVAGSPVPMYICGSKAVAMYPFGPVPGVACMITMISMAGTCFVGTNSDTAAITDITLFHKCLREGFEEVIASDKTTVASKPRPARKKAPAKAATKPTTKSASKSASKPADGTQETKP